MEARWNSSRLFPYLDLLLWRSFHLSRPRAKLALLEPCPSPAPRGFHRGRPHPQFIGGRHGLHMEEAPRLRQEGEPLVGGVHHRGRGRRWTTRDPAKGRRKMWMELCGELFNNQGHLGAALVGSHPGLMNKPSMRVEGACASGGLAFASALDSIQAGSSDVALVAGRVPDHRVSACRRRLPCARVALLAPARHRRLHFRRCSRAVSRPAGRLGYTHGDLGLLAAKAYKMPTSTPRLT